MNYTPVQLPVAKTTNKLTTFAPKGENLLDLPEFTSLDFATRIENLLPVAGAKLEKSKGYTDYLTNGTTQISNSVKYNGVTYYGQDDKFYKNDGTTNTLIHTMTATGVFSIVRFGEYILVTNNSEKVGRYDISGTSYAAITLAPICKRLFIFNKRLACGGISTDLSEVICSEEFVGSNPPFEFPAASSPALTTDQFDFSFANAGEVNDFGQLGSQLITVYKQGESGIRADVIDTSGLGVRLNIITDFQRTSLGGIRALSTKFGLFYTSSAGVLQMLSGGATNQPYSEQNNVISNLFDDPFINTLDFDNSSLYLDEKRHLLYISCAQNSSFNNFVLIYNLDTKQWTRRTGWYISSFYNDGLTVYGSSSIEGKIYKLFDGNSDGDLDIKITFEQEFTEGQVISLSMLEEIYAGGKLSAGQVINIELDIWDKAGILKPNYKTLTWGLSSASPSGLGIGTGGGGTLPIGSGGIASSSTIASWFHKQVKIFEYSRLVVRVTEESGLPLELNWLSLITKEKGVNRKYTY